MSVLLISLLPGADARSAPPSPALKLESLRVLTTRGGRLDWGPKGHIVFDRRNLTGPRKGLYDLWRTDPDHPSREVRLTQGQDAPVGHRGNPAWHPNGEWILYQAGVKIGNKLVTHPGSGVANELWVIRPDGSEARRIFGIDDPRSFDGALHPSFHPDGNRILFSRFRSLPWNFEICFLPFDTENPQREEPIAILPRGDPRWQKGIYETHGFTPDGRGILFTGHSDPSSSWNNDILIANPVTRDLEDQVTVGEEWDEHAHFQPGSQRLLYSSARGIPDQSWNALASRADWWLREQDGRHHRLSYFSDPEWPFRHAKGPDGKLLKVPTTRLFAADGAWSPDGRRFAGVLLFREWKAREWIVILDLVEARTQAPALRNPRIAPSPGS